MYDRVLVKEMAHKSILIETNAKGSKKLTTAHVICGDNKKCRSWIGRHCENACSI